MEPVKIPAEIMPEEIRFRLKVTESGFPKLTIEINPWFQLENLDAREGVDRYAVKSYLSEDRLLFVTIDRGIYERRCCSYNSLIRTGSTDFQLSGS